MDKKNENMCVSDSQKGLGFHGVIFRVTFQDAMGQLLRTRTRLEALTLVSWPLSNLDHYFLLT